MATQVKNILIFFILLIPLCIPLIYRYGHACQIKSLLLLPEEGSRIESALNLKFYDLSHPQATTLRV